MSTSTSPPLLFPLSFLINLPISTPRALQIIRLFYLS
nr:MAG TPA: hypothetical protein [Caudoviricetes sp.]